MLPSRSLPASARILATSFAFIAVSASAQDTASQTSAFEIEEIVVTALKYETILQQTPLAITVVSGETLVDRGIDNVTDLLRATPGLAVLDQGAGQRRFIVRGVQSAGEAQTGLYYDESPVGAGSPSTTNDAGQRMPEVRLFDVERIEVLRGPQGTLYGSGSMGGTVRVLFNKPTNEFGAQVNSSVETSEEGELDYQADGMINVPLGEQLAGRAVVFHRDRGGYIDNVTLGRDDVNDEEASGGRVQLRYTPTDALTIDIAAHLQREDAFVSVWELPAGTYRTAVPTQLPVADDFELYNVTLKWDLGFATMTGVTSLFNRDLLVTIDGSRFLSFVLPNVPRDALRSVLRQPQEIEDRSHELRLSSNGEGPFVWTVGGYFENRDAFTVNKHLFTDFATGLPRTPEAIVFHRTIGDVLEQRALFAEVSYDLTAALTLTVGGRYFDYEREVTGQTIVPFAGFGFPQATDPETFEFDEDGVVAKVNVAYQFGERALVYTQANQGFRPGGLNDVVGLNQALVPYESDSTWNYELGVKTNWFENRASVNLAAFRIDWEDMQVTGQTPPPSPIRFIANAGEAQIDGVELEAIALPTEHFELTLAAAYMDARLTADQVSADVIAPGRKGDRIPNVPKVSGTFALEYKQQFGAALYGSVRTDVNYVGESFSEFRPTSIFYERIPDYTLTNVRLRLESIASNWNVDLFVNNVFDEVAIGRILSSRFGSDLAQSAPPRTVGMSLSKSF